MIFRILFCLSTFPPARNASQREAGGEESLKTKSLREEESGAY